MKNRPSAYGRIGGSSPYFLPKDGRIGNRCRSHPPFGFGLFPRRSGPRSRNGIGSAGSPRLTHPCFLSGVFFLGAPPDFAGPGNPCRISKKTLSCIASNAAPLIPLFPAHSSVFPLIIPPLLGPRKPLQRRFGSLQERFFQLVYSNGLIDFPGFIL